MSEKTKRYTYTCFLINNPILYTSLIHKKGFALYIRIILKFKKYSFNTTIIRVIEIRKQLDSLYYYLSTLTLNCWFVDRQQKRTYKFIIGICQKIYTTSIWIRFPVVLLFRQFRILLFPKHRIWKEGDSLKGCKNNIEKWLTKMIITITNKRNKL